MSTSRKKSASSSRGKKAQDAVDQANLSAEQRKRLDQLIVLRQLMGQMVPIEPGDLSSLTGHGPYISLEALYIALLILQQGVRYQDSIPGTRTPSEGRDTGGGGGSGNQNRIVESVPFWKRFWKTLFSVILALITALPTIITLYDRYLTN